MHRTTRLDLTASASPRHSARWMTIADSEQTSSHRNRCEIVVHFEPNGSGSL